ncbi:molybdate ABC transporter substrate-binding protein [Sulfurivirga sp.]|uniref:molybdate ABC transporter substrate-binding protein n=1 Tax=Sulfurivirga sp. TaxID=2614236 RepID=UPI0025D153A4|nr:molybdate ABC transporter substrate-binding protein [Sulfurivirga sp.]
MRALLVLSLLLLVVPVRAEPPLLAASAANFADTLRDLAALYRQRGGAEVRVVTGSTGRLFHQLAHGAPYGLFFAADVARPDKLHRMGRAGVPQVYALGRLVLWSPSGEPLARLRRGDFRHLAMANPRTAPYGLAARQTLKKLGLWPRYAARTVRGENVGQAFEYVRSGNAELGFVALSQAVRARLPAAQLWQVPADHHAPLAQAAVVTARDPAQRERARAFLDFVLHDPAARTLIRRHGYDLPEESG